MPAERALERRVVTALFADLAGFTTLGESLDPEDLRAVQDAYFAAARETVERYGGVLEKYIGDAVVALFGIPRTRDDDAERAVRAGLALVGAIEQLGATVGLEPTALRVRVGVNTGEVLAGEEGPERGAATGDTVNVAARLQAAAVPGTVLIGEETALAVEAAIELDEPQELELKGKSGVARARRATTIRPEPSRERAGSRPPRKSSAAGSGGARAGRADRARTARGCTGGSLANAQARSRARRARGRQARRRSRPRT
jgi:class 3 adenylate cyclase